MNSDVYDNLNEAKTKLMDSQYVTTSDYMEFIRTAVDDALDELDRLREENEELRKELQPRSTRNENYLEFHESRDELQEKYNG